jgi:hypothetical protein
LKRKNRPDVGLLPVSMSDLLSSPRLGLFLNIVTSTRYGNIDGVEIDLRHDKLKSGEWHAAVFGMPPNLKERDPDEPFLWFPWFGNFDLVKLQRKATRLFSARTQSDTNLGANDLGDYVKMNTPECFVSPGDKLCIESVFGMRVGDRYENTHNSEIRLARLQVIRKNAETQKVPTMLKFVRTKNITERETYDVCRTISDHICEHFGLKDFSESESVSVDTSFAYRALSSARRRAKTPAKPTRLCWQKPNAAGSTSRRPTPAPGSSMGGGQPMSPPTA